MPACENWGPRRAITVFLNVKNRRERLKGPKTTEARSFYGFFDKIVKDGVEGGDRPKTYSYSA